MESPPIIVQDVKPTGPKTMRQVEWLQNAPSRFDFYIGMVVPLILKEPQRYELGVGSDTVDVKRIFSIAMMMAINASEVAVEIKFTNADETGCAMVSPIKE
jgi:hypothetical protein